MFRSPKTRRTIALILLFNTIGNLALPSVSYALTNGANQVEFTSYEDTGTTDMVNLTTGDLTYNMPLLEVPSPEGGFTVPLFYHSGIGLEDESSWVGLGWNVNVGAITRNKAGYADDAYDHVVKVDTKDPGGSYFVKNYILYQRSWDSQKGYGGAIDLLGVAGFDWTNSGGLRSGNVIGLTFNKDKATFDPDRAIIAAQTIAMTVATAGGGATFGKSVTGTQLATAKALATGYNIASTALSLYQGYKSQGTISGSYNNWSTETTTSKWGFRVDGKYWLDDTRREHSFGALYLGSTHKSGVEPACQNCSDGSTTPRIGNPQNYRLTNWFEMAAGNSKAVASDMYTHINKDRSYPLNVNSTHVSYDFYSVMGLGVGGSISPYRLDIGSLAFPKRMSNATTMHNAFPFLEEGNPSTGIDKVQFQYNGDISNTYTHHNSNGFGATAYRSDSRLYYDQVDPKLEVAGSRIESPREGLYNKRLAHGKHVEWFTNEEMASNAPISQGKILEYGPLDQLRNAFRSSIWPPKGIGAFVVTREDGTTYHYALPVYNNNEVYYQGTKGEEETKYSESDNREPYATSWLLTAITGPDFVDRGTTGIVDEQDWGYWIKFDYGRFASDYAWRMPYYNYLEGENNTVSYSTGHKETYYLNSIQTRTHTALFIKNIRKDGRSAYWNGYSEIPFQYRHTPNAYPASSLGLEEIILLNNKDYKELINQGFAQDPFGNNPVERELLQGALGESTTCDLDQVYDVYDAPSYSALRSFLDQKTLKKIKFSYSYNLCKGTLNSFESTAHPPANQPYFGVRMGKLTLERVSILGANNVKLLPDYIFEYNGLNTRYQQESWDGWGMYNPFGNTDPNSHKASLGEDRYSWHLTRIHSPLGSTSEIEYQNDSYSSVNGLPVRDKYGNIIEQISGGDVRVSKITTNDDNGIYSTGYTYTKNGQSWGVSSGVVSKEPEYIMQHEYPFYKEYDYPSTSVLYDKVTVLNGMQPNGTYTSKTQYEFYTPGVMDISSQSQKIYDQHTGLYYVDSPLFLKQYHHNINVYTSRIGKVKTVKTFNKVDQLTKSSEFVYTNDLGNGQGKFTTGSILSETVLDQLNPTITATKFLRTTKTYYPTVLQSVKTYSGGINASETTNKKWDFYTGQVLESEIRNSLGVNYLSVVVPAYRKYATMGPKAENAAHKNMLSQVAANYLYKKDATGNLTPVSVGVQTWKGDWTNYRVYDPTKEKYVYGSEGPEVWRAHESWSWDGRELNPDGTLKNFVDFDWTKTNLDNRWLKTGEVVQFDHYSTPLMSKDLNGNYTSTKLGYNQQQMIASAANTRYTEIAYSGAEDRDLSGVREQFGGEIFHAYQQDQTYKHTGNYSIKLNPLDVGFTYVAMAGHATDANTEVEVGRQYRVSAWIHQGDITNKAAQIYATLDNGTTLKTAKIDNPGTERAGDWYLVNMYFELPNTAAGKMLRVGCSNTGSTEVYIDDFRFHPVDAPLTTYVYNPHTQQVTYILDNDNLYTRYEYDASGALIKTYRERLGATKSDQLVSEKRYNYARTVE